MITYEVAEELVQNASEEYVDREENQRCPYCHSDSIEEIGLDRDFWDALCAQMQCGACGLRWDEQYLLHEIVYMGGPTNEPAKAD